VKDDVEKGHGWTMNIGYKLIGGTVQGMDLSVEVKQGWRQKVFL